MPVMRMVGGLSRRAGRGVKKTGKRDGSDQRGVGKRSPGAGALWRVSLNRV